MEWRFKFTVIRTNLESVIALIVPLFVMGFIFNNIGEVGYWEAQNFTIFLILGSEVALLRIVISSIPASFVREKYWKSLAALMIAPIHRFTFLIGMLISAFIRFIAPFIIFLIICFVLSPVSLLTVASIVVILLLIALIFMGVGTFIGVFAMSQESIWQFLDFSMRFVFMFSALFYPLEIYPEIVRTAIRLNPLYYVFDFLRLVWIEDNIFYSIGAHPFSFVVLVALSVLLPAISVYLFDKIYKKFGIEGGQ